MDRIETMKILGTLRESFPNGAEITEMTVDLWAALFEEYEYDAAWQATLQVCKEWKAYTMPPPAAIIEKLEIAENRVSPSELLDLRAEADQMLRRGTRLTALDFEEASREIQLFFGSAGRMRSLALGNADYANRELDRFVKAIPELRATIRSNEKKLLGAGPERMMLE
jgi:hypothetical protein